MKALTLTVVQFNSFIKQIFDAEEFLLNIAIVGEVTNFKISGNNAFFDLKDSQAMISCIKFGTDGFKIKNGDKVTVFGKVNFYIKSGKFSFIVQRAEIMGQGDLYQKFLMLKEKLEKDGYFKPEIKKEIPKFAKRIGVVTSETGAVIRDIINVTKSKNPFTDIVVYPSKVQGLLAENELASGIKYFNTRDDIDVIIVARGGGSLQDLEPFNTEKIVLAIYDSIKPIISAVGHETDFTLCDFASDLRVPTPSVAAEVAVFDYYEQIRNIERTLILCNTYITNSVRQKKTNLKSTTESVIDKLKLKIGDNNSKLTAVIRDIEQNVKNHLKEKQNEIEKVTSIISKLNPLEILKSGYAIVETSDKKINNISDINTGDEIKVVINDGTISAMVTSIEKTDEKIKNTKNTKITKNTKNAAKKNTKPSVE